MNSTIFRPGGSLTSVAEKTGAESLLTCSMLFSRRTLLIGRLQAVGAPRPGQMDCRERSYSDTKASIALPGVFPVGEAKGPCEIEVYSLESKLYGSFLCLCPGTTMSSLALFLCSLMEELLHT